MWSVLVSVSLGNGWDEWDQVPGFSFARNERDTAADAARHARGIVDRKRESVVRVQVLNNETGFFDQEFTLSPIRF